MNRNVRQEIFHGVVGEGFEKSLLIHAGIQAKQNFGAALSPD
jgi:hypothetical protein